MHSKALLSSWLSSELGNYIAAHWTRPSHTATTNYTQAFPTTVVFSLPVKLREMWEIATIVKNMDFKNFRMPDGKLREHAKIMDFRIFRMSDLKCRKHIKIIDFRMFRMSDLMHSESLPSWLSSELGT